MEECFKPAVQQLGQISTGAQVSPGRVIRVQEGAVLYQTRIRVIDGFNTPQAETLAEAISDKGAEEAILDAMAIQFGVTDIVEGGTFDEQKTAMRYRTSKASGNTPTLVKEAPPSPLLPVRQSDSLLLKIDQLRLKAEAIEATEGRAIQVEQGGASNQKRRIRIIDDFDTHYQSYAAHVVCTENIANAIASTMQIVYGAQRIVERGTFVEKKAGLRYQIPEPSETRRSDNIVSEDKASRGR